MIICLRIAQSSPIGVYHHMETENKTVFHLQNTDEAWVETSAWHVHCPSNFAGDLAQMYKQSRTSSVAWLDVIIIDEDSKSDGAARIQLYDSRDGHRYDPFASHREFIELAVFGHVLGHRDMPFVYKPAPVPHALHTDGEPLKEIACLDPNHTHYICIDDGASDNSICLHRMCGSLLD